MKAAAASALIIAVVKPNNPLPVEPEWPTSPPGRPTVMLIDASSRLEATLMEAWIERHRPEGPPPTIIHLASSRRRRPATRIAPHLDRHLSDPADPYFVPLRVAWFPHERYGRRSVSWADLWKLGDPRDPNALRQRVILSRWPHRCRVIVGEGASASTLRADHISSVEVQPLVNFVTRRAWLALERGERQQRGNRYKVPKFVHEEITAAVSFNTESITAGALRGLSPDHAVKRARHYLKEIAASHSPFVIDLIANAIHWLYTQGYGAILYDRDRVAEIASLGSTHSLAFLPSHRSNLDRLSLQFLLWENDLPPNHTAGGINMNFFPVGPLIRRTGVFFIRRSFKDNPLYKFVLQTYLDYLIGNRFPLEWYMEGGRSRSGKLLPPRFGMLSYAVDAVHRGKADDLYLVPISIVYDHIQDVDAYATEARGGTKEKESLGWVLSAIRALRRRYGNIHVRFGEPISVRKFLPDGELAEGSVDIAKLAFEVMFRVGQVTPITPTALVAITLLAAKGNARTITELASLAEQLDRYVTVRQLPITEPLRLENPAELGRVLNQLVQHGNASTFDGPDGRVYWLNADQWPKVAYYRNVIVHFFLPRAVAELALLAVGERGDPAADFWEEVARLRDLLKFEFFFPDKDQFRVAISSDLGADMPEWEAKLAAGETGKVFERLSLLASDWSLLPFFDAYQIVADQLADTVGPFEEKAFVPACLVRAKAYRLRGLLTSDEGISQVLYRSAISLASNRGLVDAADPAARRQFSDELRLVRSRAAQVSKLRR